MDMAVREMNHRRFVDARQLLELLLQLVQLLFIGANGEFERSRFLVLQNLTRSDGYVIRLALVTDLKSPPLPFSGRAARPCPIFSTVSLSYVDASEVFANGFPPRRVKTALK